ncbi:MAG: hypothetical protein MRY32_04475 [Rickettsiales bacterium]|nr:hypothetical protein [Rickettsiales bacterium]
MSDDDEQNEDQTQPTDSVITGHDEHVMSSQAATNVLNLIADDVGHISVMSYNPATDRYSSHDIELLYPDCGDRVARLFFSAMHKGELAEAGNFTRNFISFKMRHDFVFFLESQTGEGFTAQSLRKAVDDYCEWFHSPEYQNHLRAYSQLVKLAVEPVELHSTYHIPEQYARFDFSHFDDSALEDEPGEQPKDIGLMDAAGSDVKDRPVELKDMPPANRDVADIYSEPENPADIDLADAEVASDDRVAAEHTPDTAVEDEKEAGEELDDDEHDIEDEGESLTLSHRMQIEGVKLDPSAEASIRLSRMMHHLDTHRDALFMPLQPHQIQHIDVERRDLVDAPFDDLSTHDNNTHKGVESKLAVLGNGAKTLRDMAQRSEMEARGGRRKRIRNMMNPDDAMPAVAFSRTLLDMTEHAFEPRLSPTKLKRAWTQSFLKLEAHANADDTRDLEMESGDFMLGETRVSHGGAISSTAALGMGRGNGPIKQ